MTNANRLIESVGGHEPTQVLFFIGSLQGGGAERSLIEVINHLDRSRFVPALALLHKDGPYLSELKDDVRVYELSGCGGFRRTLRFRKAMQRLVTELRPSLIMSTLVGPNRTLLRGLIGCKDVPPIVVCEQNNLSSTLMKSESRAIRFLKGMEVRLLYRGATKIIAVSQGVKADLVENHGMPRDKIAAIHNPVDTDRVRRSLANATGHPERDQGGAKQIVAVGRLTRQKGFHDLLEAFARVRDARPAQLTILGEGELRRELEDHAAELGIGDHVHMPGFVDDPWPIIHASDLYVMSSYWEGLPLVLLEVIACETPIVATDCDFGPREIITPNQDGLLVPVGDIGALSEAMVSILEDPQLGERFAANALRRLEAFDVRAIANEYECLFDQLTSR